MTCFFLKLCRFQIGVGLLLSALGATGCHSGREHPPNLDPSTGGSGGSAGQGIDFCATPKEGCSCSTEGETVDCGRVIETYADYVVCSEGKRTCKDGLWEACIGETIVQKPLLAAQKTNRERAPARSALALSATAAACSNACDPLCSQLVDSSSGFDAGVGFVNNTTGLALEKSVIVGCQTLTITAASPTATVTQLIPTVLAAPIKLTATLAPNCMDSPFPVTWTVDRFDIASVVGTNDTNGEFDVLHATSGDVTVTAYAAGLSATTKIHVRVNAVQSSSVAPNDLATSAQIATFNGAGTAASRVSWLYPYASTYFPLGLLAPVVQYWYSTEASGGAVKVSLRYPSGATAAASDFNYSVIVKEANTVSKAPPASRPANTTDPQIVMPQVAWQAFEQTARGKDADLVIQRLRNDGTTVEYESARTIHLVDGQLKGTVFYNSYSSQMGGVNTGAVLAIKPGASTPVLAVQPSGKCTVCHTINADASRLIAAGSRPAGGVQFNNSRRFDISNSTLWPSPTVLNSYDAPSSADVENIAGDKFNFGAVWKDGSLYLTHGGNTAYGGDKNWRAPPDYSRLYNPNVPGTIIPVSNFTNISAVTPKFSSDGTKLAFGFWGASGQTLPQSPSGTLAADTTGKTLVVADFGCSAGSCTGASTGWQVTNVRNVTPGVAQKTAWPAFTPLGDAVLYQRQYRSAKNYLTTWSSSDVNTVAGALSEIWMSNVPADKTITATPTELRALNGLNSAGTASYLPVTPATFSPSYHAANAAFTINQADDCSKSAAVTGVNDYQLNYLPAMAPVQAGGMNWVVFTSRRMYGNIAYDDPWDAEPGNKGCLGNTAACTCTSGNPPTKKLWIAALESSFTPGADPSHPAFYLSGQELMAGNSDGYWVNSACASTGVACSTSDDCCGGTGSSPTARCSAATNTCQPITSCVGAGASCAASSDCCNGLICGGTGKCVNPLYYATQTYKREYVASCPPATQVVWRFFEWQATIPTGTSIDLGVQTKAAASDGYSPSSPVAMDSIIATTPVGSWVHGTRTVDAALTGTTAVGKSLAYLLVTMKFNPDTTSTMTPTLTSWRQNFDCVDAE